MRSLRIRSPAPGLLPPQKMEEATARVLVVDDVPEICQIFRDVRMRIRSPRVQLVTEINSQRALERLRAESFDLVVSDYRMREVDGVEVLKEARARNPSGYRVLMTGYNEIPTTMSRIRDARIDGYIQKPLRGQELLLFLLGFLNHEESHVEEYRAHAREIEEAARRAEADP